MIELLTQYEDLEYFTRLQSQLRSDIWSQTDSSEQIYPLTLLHSSFLSQTDFKIFPG